MNSGHALIVDDSKTAQHRLKLMLEKFDLDIEMVSSAEEALAHLSYNQPAVIFLDHHMAGMSGMDALKTIKTNPGTALLPVVMYTAEKDELFVGQARALGALDILSKSALQPSSLERVLENLRIRPRAAAANVAVNAQKIHAVATPPRPAAAPPVVRPESDLQQVRSQVGRLFEIHLAEVRNQIDTSSQFIIKRLTSILEHKLHREKLNDNALLSKAVMADAAQSNKRASLAYAFAAAGLLALAFCSYLLFQLQDQLQRTSRNLQVAVEAGRAENMQLAASVEQAIAAQKTGDRRAADIALPRVLALMQSADFHFSHDEAPLDPLRVANLSKAVSLLAELGYSGPLVVDIRLGNFCLEPAQVTNTWRLARSDSPAALCRMSKELPHKAAVNDFLTPAYQNFLQSSAPLQDGRIRLRLVVGGFSDPVVDYPLLRTGTTAGEWNNAAMRNNGIVLRFPDSPQ